MMDHAYMCCVQSKQNNALRRLPCINVRRPVESMLLVRTNIVRLPWHKHSSQHNGVLLSTA